MTWYYLPWDYKNSRVVPWEPDESSGPSPQNNNIGLIVTKSKLVLLITQQANESREELLGGKE